MTEIKVNFVKDEDFKIPQKTYILPNCGPSENREYKYNEDKALQEITEYVKGTYGGHYSQNKFQATEFIIDGGHGTGFCIGNMLKYTQRYGHKGTPEDWRRDLMKVIHYAIMQLHVHDIEHNKEKDKE